MRPLMPPLRYTSVGIGALAAITCSVSTGYDLSGEAAMQNNARPLRCELALERVDRGLFATVTVKNLTEGSVLLLRYNLPADGAMTKSLFLIERDGEVVPYRGRAVKRSALTAEDYLELNSGSQMVSTFELTTAYDVGRSGRYTIQYRTFNPQPEPENARELVSNAVQMEIEP